MPAICQWFKNLSDSKLGRALLGLALALLLLGAAFPALWQGQLIASASDPDTDLLDLNLPRRVLAARALADGEFPLWEPHLACGTPLFAEGEAGVLYPLSLPFFMALEPTAAANCSLLSALLLLISGAYCWARSYDVHRLAASFAALSLGLGGLCAFHLRHLNIVHILALLPWGMAFINFFFTRADKRYLLGLGAVLAGQFLAGHPQIAFINMCAQAFYALALALQSARAPRATGASPVKMLGLLALTLALACLIGAAQLLPTRDLASLSLRQKAWTLEYLQKHADYGALLLRAVAPFHDNFHKRMDRAEAACVESTLYIGIVPLLLVPWAWRRSTRRQAWILLALALLFLWLSAGPRGGLYTALWRWLPGFSNFRNVERFQAPATCALALLAALGAENLRELASKRFRGGHWCIVALLIISAWDLTALNRAYSGAVSPDWIQPPATSSALPAGRVYSPLYVSCRPSDDEQAGSLHRPDFLEMRRHLLGPEMAAIWDISSPDDYAFYYAGVVLKHSGLWQYACFDNFLKADRGQLSDTQKQTWLDMLRLSHIGSLIADRPLKGIGELGVPQIVNAGASARPVYIYALPQPLPLVRLVPTLSKNAPADTLDLAGLFKPEANPCLFEPDWHRPATAGNAEIIASGRNSLSVRTQGKAGYLVIANTYHPEWSFSLDGRPAQQVLRVNYAFQAVQLPAGEHLVELRFNSQAARTGALLAGLGLMLGVAAAVNAWRQPKLG